MRIAYLFAENSINYDIDFQVLSTLSPDELNSLDTVVRTGVWGLLVGQGGKDFDQIIQDRLVPLLYGGDGPITKTNDRLIESIASDKLIYTVQFVSLGRQLALALHKRLSKHDNYLGYVQVLADLPLHRQVFNGCGPRYRIARGKVGVLYSSKEEKWSADEIITHWQENYSDLKYSIRISTLEGQKTSFRYTALDMNDGSSSDVAIQRAIRTLGDMWDEHTEKSLWRLQDVAPRALAELFAALNILKEPDLSSENVAQIATSFRRTLEEITRQFCPPANGEKPGWVKKQWKLYAEQNREKLGAYADVIESEAVGIDNSVGRLGTLYGMGNKGVHENWDVEIFRSVALRLILLVHDLMMVGPERRVVQLEQPFILSILENEL